MKKVKYSKKRDTKEVWCNKKKAHINKRLDTYAVWIEGSIEQVDNFEKFLAKKGWKDCYVAIVREYDSDNSLYCEDYYTIELEDLSHFVDLIKEFNSN